METEQETAKYQLIGFCSQLCSNSFWQNVMSYPLEEMGTDLNEFAINLRKLFYAAVLNSLKINPVGSTEALWRVKRAMQMETDRCRAIPMGLLDNGRIDSRNKPILDFAYLAYQALARNLERCGRPLDAADIYEKRLKMYDKARQLREKDKQVIVKRTDISVNLNTLLQEFKNGGIVAVYRCPHCGGTLKIGKNTSVESLRVCEHCGSEIETMDLADFLKSALG